MWPGALGGQEEIAEGRVTATHNPPKILFFPLSGLCGGGHSLSISPVSGRILQCWDDQGDLDTAGLCVTEASALPETGFNTVHLSPVLLLDRWVEECTSVGPRTSHIVDWVPWWWSRWLGAHCFPGVGLDLTSRSLTWQCPYSKQPCAVVRLVCFARTQGQSSPWLGRGSPDRHMPKVGRGCVVSCCGAGREAGATPLCSRGHELPALQTGDQGHLAQLLPNW